MARMSSTSLHASASGGSSLRAAGGHASRPRLAAAVGANYPGPDGKIRPPRARTRGAATTGRSADAGDGGEHANLGPPSHQGISRADSDPVQVVSPTPNNASVPLQFGLGLGSERLASSERASSS